MSSQGCLTAFFLMLVVAWSLVIGGLITAGWIGAEIVQFVVAVVFADVEAGRRAGDGIVQGLRTIGFGLLAAIWAIGTGVLALLWFGFARGARRADMVVVETETIGITIDVPPADRMKDVTPHKGAPPPEIMPPDKPSR